MSTHALHPRSPLAPPDLPLRRCFVTPRNLEERFLLTSSLWSSVSAAAPDREGGADLLRVRWERGVPVPISSPAPAGGASSGRVQLQPDKPLPALGSRRGPSA